jgi:hypothetical protein
MDALSPSARWSSFRPKPGMHGCWTSHVNLLPDSPATGDPEPIDFQETDTNYAIGRKGNYRIQDGAFVYIDRKSGRIITILGYPSAEIGRLG